MFILPQALFDTHKKEFHVYLDLLLKWNSKINLTSFTKPSEINELHFLDSLAFAYFFEAEAFRNVSRETFLDIGAGNGLPGLALKIVFPEIDLILAESIQKKCAFMKTVIRALSLKNTEVLNQTLSNKEPINQFDFVISRAFSSLEHFMKIGAPHVKPGGFLVTLKGEKAEEEIREAQRLLPEHGLTSFESKTYQLPSKEKRKIVWATKNKCFT